MEPLIEYELCEGNIARISLNRAEKRNAQSTALLYELNDAFDRAVQDDEVKVIILAANGPHFSSGHDLSEGAEHFDKLVAETANYDTVGTWTGFAKPGFEGHFAREMEIFYGFSERWRNIPKPTIAQVQGKVVAGGLMLVWPCDMIVAAEDASFQDNTLFMGICGVEYFAHPWELGNRKAKEFLFTGDPISAAEAKEIGMVSRVVPNDSLAEETMALAKKVAAKASFTLKLTKDIINAAEDAQGRKGVMQMAYGYHHLLHGHWSEIAGLTADPEFLSSSRGVPPGGWKKRDGSPVE